MTPNAAPQGAQVGGSIPGPVGSDSESRSCGYPIAALHSLQHTEGTWSCTLSISQPQQLLRDNLECYELG